MKFPVELRKMRELIIFTEKEKRGIVVLLCLIFLMIVTDIVLLPIINRESKYDFSAWENEIDAYLASQKSVQPQEGWNIPFFNPNEVD